MWLHPGRREPQWVQYFKWVILELLNVRFRTVFVTPVTITDDDISEATQRAKSILEELGMDKLLKIHSIWDNESTTDDLLAQPKNSGDDDDDIDNIDIDCNSDINLDDTSAVAIVQEVCLDTQDQLKNDVHSAYSGGLVTKEGKERLHKMQKALPVEHLSSDTIPMFS